MGEISLKNVPNCLKYALLIWSTLKIHQDIEILTEIWNCSHFPYDQKKRMCLEINFCVVKADLNTLVESEPGKKYSIWKPI